jgi:hypothetical protein
MPTPVDTLAQMRAKGAFKKYIDYVRFPRFRSLEPNTRIDFGFPVTAFVGQNGCGKSSALHALFGCPKGKSVGSYWFNTALDPIAELDPDDRHCLIYSYDGQGPSREVLKTRINKVGKLDLWDTSEALQRYGMASPGTRTLEPLEKEVVYLNFRVVQNAFEKRFHSNRPPAAGIQEHLREKTKQLRRAINGQGLKGNYQYETHDQPIVFPAGQVEAIGKILGRRYVGAQMIRHRFFGYWGHSVILQTEHASYTEAFAGSGEFAVATLVHDIMAAPENALLLLDEPETSLHPAAQRGVIEFILSESIKKKHQTVICTHAPAMIEGLPPSAVKVFAPTANGRFGVYQDVMPSEAFFFLGQPVGNKLVVRVEDRLGKAAVDQVLESLGAATKNLFDVRFYPGGVDTMKRDAAIYARENSATVLLMDGDQRPKEIVKVVNASDVGTKVEKSANVFDPATLPMYVHNDPAAAVALLDSEIKKATGTKIEFASDGGAGGGNKEQQRDARIQYLNYYRTWVHFLPMDTPEEMFWNEDLALQLLGTLAPDVAQETGTSIAAQPDIKSKFKLFTEVISTSSSAQHIEVIHQMFLKRWLKDKPKSFDQLRDLLVSLKKLFPA